MSKYNLNKTRCIRYNVSSLQLPEIKKDYEDRIRALYNELDEEEIDSGEWRKCEDIIRKAAVEKIGKLGTNDRNGWFNQECAEVTEEKNRKYRRMTQRQLTRAAREEYSEATRKVKQNTQKEKEKIL
jgi:hypothetical protein